MAKKKSNSKLSVIRRAAARERWRGHELAPTRTVRLRVDLITRLQTLPGESMSDKIERLLPNP